MTPFELPARDPTPTDYELGGTSSGASDAGGMSSAASETGSNVTFRDVSERRQKTKTTRMAADIDKELGTPCIEIT